MHEGSGHLLRVLQAVRCFVPGSRSNSRVILFAFDPWRSAILLVAGDKSGNWRQWYRQAIPRAEQLLEIYLKERAQEEAGAGDVYEVVADPG
jgi:hypothetical protein